MNDSKMLTEGALLTVVYSILLVIALFFPLIGIVVFFVLPVPFIMFASRYGWKPSLLMGAAAILVSMLIATSVTLPVTVFVGIGGIAAGIAIYKGLSSYESWAVGTIGFAVGLVLVYAFIQTVLNINIVGTIEASINQSLEMMESLGVPSYMSGEMYQNFTEQFAVIKDLIPAVIVIMAILFAFINVWVSFKIKNRIESTTLYFPPFHSFNLPVSVIWIYFMALIITFFDIDQDSFLFVGVANVIVLATLLLTIQGFSLIFCIAHIKKWPKAIPIISIVLGFIIPGLIYLIQMLGIIDLGFSVKHRLSGKKKS